MVKQSMPMKRSVAPMAPVTAMMESEEVVKENLK